MGRKKKTSDRDIKAFFRDYGKAVGRRKILLSKTHARQMTVSEANEYRNLGVFIQCIDEMVNTLEPLVAKIMHNTLFNISMEINYCYEHVSYLKNLGCDDIRRMLAGKEILTSEYSKNLCEAIVKVVEDK